MRKWKDVIVRCVYDEEMERLVIVHCVCDEEMEKCDCMLHV